MPSQMSESPMVLTAARRSAFMSSSCMARLAEVQ